MQPADDPEPDAQLWEGRSSIKGHPEWKDNSTQPPCNFSKVCPNCFLRVKVLQPESLDFGPSSLFPAQIYQTRKFYQHGKGSERPCLLRTLWNGFWNLLNFVQTTNVPFWPLSISSNFGREVYPWSHLFVCLRLAPGRGPAPMGRRLKDRSAETLTVLTNDGQTATIRGGNAPVHKERRTHNFTNIVDSNLPGARF